MRSRIVAVVLVIGVAVLFALMALLTYYASLVTVMEIQ